MRSAILLRMTARSAALVRPQAGNAFHPAATARSTSVESPRATSVNTLPVTGVGFSKYCPLADGTYSPPMKWSYRDRYATREPGSPGAA